VEEKVESPKRVFASPYNGKAEIFNPLVLETLERLGPFEEPKNFSSNWWILNDGSIF
jgi:hypothetical protein